jgi:molybdopterin synthase catalytic subunit
MKTKDTSRAGPGGTGSLRDVDDRVTAVITDLPLETLSALREVGSTADGAWLVFEGRVREENAGRRVRELEYSAYDEMAEKELRAMAAEALDRFELGEIVAAHRVGRLEPGLASVAIAVSAPHRDACYAASRWMIDEIKSRLPVWKRERYVDGTEDWVSAGEAQT